MTKYFDCLRATPLHMFDVRNTIHEYYHFTHQCLHQWKYPFHYQRYVSQSFTRTEIKFSDFNFVHGLCRTSVVWGLAWKTGLLLSGHCQRNLPTDNLIYKRKMTSRDLCCLENWPLKIKTALIALLQPPLLLYPNRYWPTVFQNWLRSPKLKTVTETAQIRCLQLEILVHWHLKRWDFIVFYLWRWEFG